MFAVIKTGGKQYRVAADQRITIEKVKGELGDIVEFPEVLVVGGDNILVGSPVVAGALVAGEVVKQIRGDKAIAFKKRRRQNSRRKRGHRQELSVVRITEILTDGKKPTIVAKPKPEPKPEPVPAPAADEGAAAQASAKPKARTAKPAKPPAKPKAKKPAKAAAKKPAKPKAAAPKGKGKKK